MRKRGGSSSGSSDSNVTAPPSVVVPEETKPEVSAPSTSVTPSQPEVSEPSTSVTPSQPEDSNKNLSFSNGSISVDSGSATVTGTLSSSETATKGIVANNSSVTHDGVIELTGDESVGLHGKGDSNENQITNTGTISVLGKESVGIYAENGIKATNEAEINVGENSIGIKGENGSDIENNGIINVGESSSTTFVTRVEAGEHDIETIGMKIIGGKAENNGSINLKGNGIGIYAENATAINNKQIQVNGLGIGMNLSNNSEGSNNGTIELIEAVDLSYGVRIEKESKFVNGETGKIIVKGNDSIVAFNSSGIFENYGEIKAIGENNFGTRIKEKNTTIRTKFVNGETGKIIVEGTNSIGVYNSGGIFENYGEIEIVGENITGIRVTGMENEKNIVNNEGIIKVIASGADEFGRGIYASGDTEVTNMGTIELLSSAYITNNEDGEKVTKFTGISGIIAENITNREVKNDVTGEIILGYGWGMSAKNSIITNNGKILALASKTPDYSSEFEVDTEYDSIGMIGKNNSTLINGKTGKIILEGLTDDSGTYGMRIENSDAINEGLIKITGVPFGIGINDENSTKLVNIENSGIIMISGEGYVVGIKARGIPTNPSNIINDGIIQVESENGSAYGISISEGNVKNSGTITVTGNGARGINIIGDEVSAINEVGGVINVDGYGAWGMSAYDGATVINEGIINVGKTAFGGMYADFNSKAINKGTINIDKNNTIAVALEGQGTLNTEEGIVNRDGEVNVVIDSTLGGTYVIGTSESRSYGKLNTGSVYMNGVTEVEAEIAKGGYEKEYLLKDAVNADELELGNEFKLVSTSLLYDVEGISENGNLDAKLTRNDKTLADFTDGYISETAEIVGQYQNAESFTTLTKDAQQVVNSIDTSSSETITRDLKALTPDIYANTARQIYDISKVFAEQDVKVINSIGPEKFNFNLFGNYSDLDTRHDIEGYKSIMTGFVGAMDFGYNTFGSIGYGYSDIDYKGDSNGKIQSIHLGLNRFEKINGLDLRLGLNGEYNFHEVKRDISNFSRRAKADFNSYWIGLTGEVGKTYGVGLYARPFASLEVGFGGHESFTEKRAESLNAHLSSKNYTSVLPKVGVKVGADMEKVSLYASADFSYEIGNMDKTERFSFEGFNGTASLHRDKLESGLGTFKVGADSKIVNFDIGISGGVQVGRRDRAFGELSIGYRF